MRWMCYKVRRQEPWELLGTPAGTPVRWEKLVSPLPVLSGGNSATRLPSRGWAGGPGHLGPYPCHSWVPICVALSGLVWVFLNQHPWRGSIIRHVRNQQKTLEGPNGRGWRGSWWSIGCVSDTLNGNSNNNILLSTISLSSRYFAHIVYIFQQPCEVGIIIIITT